MKVSSIAIAAAYLAASGAVAVPLDAREESGLFFGPGNIFGNLFDGASCIFSAFIGGRTPLCFNSNGRNGDGVGLAVSQSQQASGKTPTASDLNKNGYDFNYDTKSDGTLHITIKPKDSSKQNCTVDQKPGQGESTQDVIQAAAIKCLNG